MFQSNCPIFKKHTILKAHILQSGITGERYALQRLYQGYSNGILSGATVRVFGDKLQLDPGVILYQGRLYVMNEKLEIPYKSNKNRQYIYLRFWELRKDEYMEYYESEVLITTEKSSRINDLCLGNFLLNEGAVLRDNYQNLKDFITEHDTFNIIEVPYASLGKDTFSPIITEFIGQQLFITKCSNALDAAFAIECMKGEPVRYKLLISYIENRLNISIDEYVERKQIFELLYNIVENAQCANKRTKDYRPRQIQVY